METVTKTTCKHCNGPIEGKGKFCSDKCKQAAYRAKRNTVTPPTVTNGPVTQSESVTVNEQDDGPSIAHYNANPSRYAPRTNPQLLNWGKPMSGEQLAHFKLVANRVPIPGDWDYAGVVTEQESTRADRGHREAGGGSE